MTQCGGCQYYIGTIVNTEIVQWMPRIEVVVLFVIDDRWSYWGCPVDAKKGKDEKWGGKKPPF